MHFQFSVVTLKAELFPVCRAWLTWPDLTVDVDQIFTEWKRNIEKKKESEDIGFQRSVSFPFTHSDGNVVDTVALYDEKSNVLKAPWFSVNKSTEQKIKSKKMNK